MTSFLHWFSSFNQLLPFGWSFSKFCQEVFIKPWTPRQEPFIADDAGLTSLETDRELCAAEYRKFKELVSSTHNPEVIFLAIDTVGQTHVDSPISQLGLSFWIPQRKRATKCYQWHIEGAPIEMSQIPDLTASDDVHFDDKFTISESEITELLHLQLETVSRKYKVIVVFYDLDKSLGRLGDKLNLHGDLVLLDARKIWRHNRRDREDMALGDCVDNISPHCHHLSNQPSAGNNAYHITRILETSPIDNDGRIF